MDRSMSAALSATPHSELTLNDISTTSSYNNFPFHGQSNNNNGNGNGNMLASSNSSAATNPNILLLRNRKLQLEVQRKDGEIRRLTREFEASKKKNTATVVELQGEVQRLREQFLEKEVALERTAEYFSIPLSSVNPSQYSSFNLRQFMSQLVANLFKLHHSSAELWEAVRHFVDGKRSDSGDVQLINVPVHAPDSADNLGFHDVVRKVNVLLGQVQDQMRDSNTQLSHGIDSVKAHLKPPMNELVKKVGEAKSQVAALREEAIDNLAAGAAEAEDLIRKAGSQLVNRLRRAEGSAKRAAARAAKLEQELADVNAATEELSQQLRDEFDRAADNIARLEAANAAKQDEVDALEAARLGDNARHKLELETATSQVKKEAEEAAAIAAKKEEALQHLVDATGAELGFVEAARVQLQAKHDAQAKKLVDQTEQLARLREEQLKTEDLLRSARDANDELAQELDQTQRAASEAATAAADAAKMAATASKKAKADAAEELETALARQQKLSDALDGAASEREALRAELDGVRQQQEALQSQKLELEEAVAALAEARERREQEFQLERKLGAEEIASIEAAAKRDQDAALETKEALEEAIDAVTHDKCNLEEALAALADAREHQAEEIQALRDALQVVSSEREQVAEEMASVAAAAEQAQSLLQAERDAADARNAALQEEHVQMQDEFAQLSADLLTKVDAIAHENELLEAAKAALEMDVSELNDQVGQNLEQLKFEQEASLAARKRASQKEAAMHHAANEQQEALQAQLQEANEAFHEAANEAASRAKSLENQVEELKKQRELEDNLLVQRVRDLQRECEEKDEALAKEKQRLIDSASAADDRYAEALKELEAELHEAKLTSASLETELGGAKLEGESAEEAKQMLAAKLAADRALRSSELKAAKAEAAAEAATAAAEAAEAASAFRKQHDVETKLKALTDEFNQQALLVEAAEKAEDEKTVALANEVSSLNALTNEHEATISALQHEIKEARDLVSEERQKRTALDVVNSALNKELMDSHHLLYRHGRGLELGLEPPAKGSESNSPPLIAKRRSPPTTPGGAAEISVSGDVGVLSPHTPRARPLPTSEAYLMRAAAQATAEAKAALDDSIRAQHRATAAALRSGASPILDYETHMASLSLQSMSSPEMHSHGSGRSPTPHIQHHVRDHYPNYHPNGSTTPSPMLDHHHYRSLGSRAATSQPGWNLHETPLRDSPSQAGPPTRRAMHTPQKFTNVQGEGSQQRQWGGRLGSGEYNGSFFNIAGEPVLPPASSEQPRGSHQRRSPSFTIPANVGEERFIQSGAMDPNPVPQLPNPKRVQLLSKTTTRVVLAPSYQASEPSTPAAIEVKEQPQKAILEEEEAIYVGGLSDDSSGSDRLDHDSSDLSSGSSHGTDPIAAVADAVVARSTSPSSAKGSTRRPKRQSHGSQQPFSARLAAARTAARRAAGAPTDSTAGAELSHVNVGDSRSSPTTANSDSGPDQAGKRMHDSDDLGFDYEDDFEGDSDLEAEPLGTPAAAGAVQAPSSSTAAWGTPIRDASPQAPDTKVLFPDGDASPISSAATMHAKAVATLTTAMQFANFLPSPTSSAGKNGATRTTRTASMAGRGSALATASPQKNPPRPAELSVSEAADVDISAEVDALNASWAKRIDAADSVEQIRAVELQELREMQARASKALAGEQGLAAAALQKHAPSQPDQNPNVENSGPATVAHSSALDAIRNEYKQKLEQRLQSAGYPSLAEKYRRNQADLKGEFDRQSEKLNKLLLASPTPPKPRDQD